MTDDVVLLEPGDDRAKKIGKAMASQTANDILSLLKKGDLTLTEISDAMGQPMTTIKYHVENLLDAGLVEVKKVKYSEKGREVKVYGVCEQVVIVSAGNKDIRQILMKYASVFGFFIIATLLIGILSSTLFSGFGNIGFSGGAHESDMLFAEDYNHNELTYSAFSPADETMQVTNEDCDTVLMKTAAPNMLPPPSPDEDDNNISSMETAAGSQRQLQSSAYQKNTPEDSLHMIIISFFAGGCAILLVLMVYEAFIWRKEKKYWDNIKNKNIKEK